MNLLLKHVAASLAALCIAAVALGPLVTLAPAQVANTTLPALA